MVPPEPFSPPLPTPERRRLLILLILILAVLISGGALVVTRRGGTDAKPSRRWVELHVPSSSPTLSAEHCAGALADLDIERSRVLRCWPMPHRPGTLCYTLRGRGNPALRTFHALGAEPAGHGCPLYDPPPPGISLGRQTDPLPDRRVARMREGGRVA